MREPRIGGSRRSHQRVDDLPLDTVGEMAGVGDVLEAPPTVRNLLVLGEDIGDQREHANVLRERRGQCLRGSLALRFGGLLQKVERLLDAEVLSSDIDFRPAIVSSKSRFQAE